jgi:NAD(P)-dependent dehydrogenase (short-subunit alcohol dehydrogenase family)
MEQMLRGKVGLVTGAAGGIGRGSAEVCAEEGATVIVSDLESMEKEGRETVAIIEEACGTAAWLPCDVTSAAEQERLVAFAVERYGRLDFAHNNAGIVIEGLITEMSEEDYDRQIAVNMKGVFLGMKYQLRQMIEQGGGAIVNTSSMAGLNGSPEAVGYVASKHGVIGLTKTAAAEWVGHNIRVNCICPGGTWTPMMRRQPPDRLEVAFRSIPIGRWADPREMGSVAAWLCSDGASFVTGVAMPVDGGGALGRGFSPKKNAGGGMA